jgi:hypothetical protein
LARAEAFAYGVRVQEVRQADAAPAFERWLPRLFRRHADARFVGRLHPHFAVPLEELAQREHQAIFPCDLTVRHHAYLSVLTPDKLRWATRLLEAELRDRPGQLHYLIEYGTDLLRLNDPRGHEVLAEAADQVLAQREATRPPTPTVAALLEYVLTVSPQQSRSRLNVADARVLALRWFADSPPLLWALAQRDFQAQDYRAAAALLETLVRLGQTGAYDRSAAFDTSLMAAPALLNLAACYVRLGQLDRAEWCFRQALTHPAHQAKAQQGLDLIQQLRKH